MGIKCGELGALWGAREYGPERSAASHLALDTHGALVNYDQRFDDGEAQTCASGARVGERVKRAA